MLNSIFDIEFNPNKHLIHFDRIIALAQGKDSAPVTLELDVSSVCNHKCYWCVDPPGTHSNQIMPLTIAQKIMNEANTLGVKGIVFKGGGESTLHPEFDKILQFAYQKNFEIGLVTNGSKLYMPDLLQAIVKYCSYVRVSIDGPTTESRQDIHGINDFDQLLNSIKQLVKLKKTKRHPIIGATFCLDYSRRFLIDKCIQIGVKLDLNYILIRPPFCEEVGFSAPHTPEEAAILRKEIRQAAEQYTGNLSVMVGNWIGDQEVEKKSSTNSPKDLARRDCAVHNSKFNGIEHITGRCLASPLFLVITADCDVYGCCCLRGIKEFSFGRINYDKNITLLSIINGKQRKQNLLRMQKVECLRYCTHPLTKINEIIEYLALPQKFHSSFI
jgi:MoaA/NifB/PqqE/SkfB family radical SAM enzyme